MKKIFRTAVAVSAMVCILSGCNLPRTPGSNNATTQSVTEEAATTATISDSTPRITKVGSDINGYIDLSQGEWVKYTEEGLAGDQILAVDQATTVNNSAVITMVTYDMDVNLDTMATESMSYCESTGAQNVKGGKDTIGGFSCNKVSCYYPDYNRNLDAWYFVAGDGNFHYISAEYSPDDTYVADLVAQFSIGK